MKKYLLITLAVGAAFVIIGTGVAQEKRIDRLEHTLEELYLSALRQTGEEIDTLTIDMEKLRLSTDPAQSAALLASVRHAAEDVRQRLTLLPAEQQTILPLTRFAGQLAAWAQEQLPQVVRQGGLDQQSAATLAQQLALCTQLSSQLALADSVSDLSGITLSGGLASTSPATPRGLPPGEITQQEALDIARTIVGDSRVSSIQAAPGTSGPLPAFGVTVQTDDLQLNLEITRQGGKALWMMPETASFPVLQSVESCITAAQAFLALHGFAPAHAVHHQMYDGLCVIALAPVQEDVLLYPDLLRVQVRMDTAEIVGLEAHQYWLNHTQRTLIPPTLSPEEAIASLADGAQVTAHRLCLIPQGSNERLCYEFTTLYGDDTYLIYIDAANGQELQLVKVVTVESGTLTA